MIEIYFDNIACLLIYLDSKQAAQRYTSVQGFLSRKYCCKILCFKRFPDIIYSYSEVMCSKFYNSYVNLPKILRNKSKYSKKGVK